MKELERLSKTETPVPLKDKKEWELLASTECAEEFKLSLSFLSLCQGELEGPPGECKRNLSIFLLLFL